MTATPLEANCRAIATVSSRDPSSTTMISFLGHVSFSADLIVSPIHCPALYAGIRIETKGFINRHLALTSVFHRLCLADLSKHLLLSLPLFPTSIARSH